MVGEALACGTPVLSSRISGSVGLLGADYEGYFPYSDTQALADLLFRAETDVEYFDRLKKHCVNRRALVDPRRERDSLAALVREVEELRNAA